MTPKLSVGVWTGADLRSIHFADISAGQGANMALPIWGYFMKKVLADPTLGYSENAAFERPNGFNVDLECAGEDPAPRGEILEFEDFL